MYTNCVKQFSAYGSPHSLHNKVPRSNVFWNIFLIKFKILNFQEAILLYLCLVTDKTYLCLKQVEENYTALINRMKLYRENNLTLYKYIVNDLRYVLFNILALY
jgi:hypothetical protein